MRRPVHSRHPSSSGISFPESVPGRARFQTSWNDEISSCAKVSARGVICLRQLPGEKTVGPEVEKTSMSSSA